MQTPEIPLEFCIPVALQEFVSSISRTLLSVPLGLVAEAPIERPPGESRGNQRRHKPELSRAGGTVQVFPVGASW